MEIKVPISVGELLDKLTILEIKEEKIQNPSSLLNVKKEKSYLQQIVKNEMQAENFHDLLSELRSINTRLWIVEDELRELEAKKDFGTKFVELARSVYKFNDTRAEIKKKINLKFGSTIIEEKSYKRYD